MWRVLFLNSHVRLLRKFFFFFFLADLKDSCTRVFCGLARKWFSFSSSFLFSCGGSGGVVAAFYFSFSVKIDGGGL